jgi:diaminohydroxyphosphoribosylaminopyrimidine deaminase / 5-amino-6-(5-phosphoribosylamino)uracil reductase
MNVSPHMKFMQRAIELAQLGPHSRNPRVGAVIVQGNEIVGEGYHQGAGTAHAEVVAISSAGVKAKGARIYVTLEPCAHHGRTGPCTDAIIAAGITSVVYSQADPSREASGGAQCLINEGIAVEGGIALHESVALNREWTHWVTHGTTYVTWKFAQSLDSRVAARFGERTAVSGNESHAATHQLRERVDAIMVGTSTMLIDNPELTARDSQGALLTKQPIRVVVGHSEIPVDSNLHTFAGGDLLHLRTHDPADVLEQLRQHGVRHVLLEGGPTLAKAFLDAGLINEVVTTIAPVTWGAGPAALMQPLVSGYNVINITYQRRGVDLVVSGELTPR